MKHIDKVHDQPVKTVELWQQLGNSDLWETETDLIVNTAALNERAAYFEVIRIPSALSESSGASVRVSA